MTLPRATYFTILAGATLWCSGLIVAPVLASRVGWPASFGQWFYSFFHTVCHQLEGRSFHMLGEPLAVCSRCASIYLAFLVGTILYPMLRGIDHPVVPSKLLLIAAAAPMALDVCAGLLGIHEVTNTTRTITGATFGILLPFVIIPAAIEAVQQLQRSAALHVRKGIGNA